METRRRVGYSVGGEDSRIKSWSSGGMEGIAGFMRVVGFEVLYM